MKNKKVLLVIGAFAGVAVVAVAIFANANGSLFTGAVRGSFGGVQRSPMIRTNPMDFVRTDTSALEPTPPVTPPPAPAPTPSPVPLPTPVPPVLNITKLNYEIGYSLASPTSFNEAIVFIAEIPAGFNATSGYIYLDGKQINSNPVIYSVTSLTARDQWNFYSPSPVLMYKASPQGLRTVLNDGVTSAARVQFPIAKITTKFCDKDGNCVDQDFMNVYPLDMLIGDF